MFTLIDTIWGKVRQYAISGLGYTQLEWGATKITNSIYIGNLASAFDKEQLHLHNINAVVCCVNGIQQVHLPTLKIALSDSETENFKQHFDSIIEFSKQYKTILYHCSYGISRSTTAALCVILSENIELSVPEALLLIREKRECVNPNSGFIRQLIDWRTDE
jgi:protein-tyrosine phosphatase